jgi:hypothetical protein
VLSSKETPSCFIKTLPSQSSLPSAYRAWLCWKEKKRKRKGEGWGEEKREGGKGSQTPRSPRASPSPASASEPGVEFGSQCVTEKSGGSKLLNL